MSEFVIETNKFLIQGYIWHSAFSLILPLSKSRTKGAAEMLRVENNVMWNDVIGMRLFDLYEPLKLDGAVNYVECHTMIEQQQQLKKLVA